MHATVKRFADTLWDLLSLERCSSRNSRPSRQRPARPRSEVMQKRYDQLVIDMKQAWGIKVHKWRSSTSGCAWELRDRNGGLSRMIESPYPRGPMSCVVFLHEIGHHAIGFGKYRPRCLEEYYAWQWAIREMKANGFNVTPAVEKRFEQAMRYALSKALRRGLKRVPSELLQFIPNEATPAMTKI